MLYPRSLKTKWLSFAPLTTNLWSSCKDKIGDVCSLLDALSLPVTISHAFCLVSWLVGWLFFLFLLFLLFIYSQNLPFTEPSQHPATKSCPDIWQDLAHWPTLIVFCNFLEGISHIFMVLSNDEVTRVFPDTSTAHTVFFFYFIFNFLFLFSLSKSFFFFFLFNILLYPFFNIPKKKKKQ